MALTWCRAGYLAWWYDGRRKVALAILKCWVQELVVCLVKINYWAVLYEQEVQDGTLGGLSAIGKLSTRWFRC